MSIYEAELKLAPYVKINKIDKNDVVVSYNRGFKNLKFEDYTLDSLKDIIEKDPNAKVKFRYWNYNFCNKNNIREAEIDLYIRDTTRPIYDKYDYFLGSIICVIYFYDIMFNCYVMDENQFDNFFNSIIIDLNIVRDNYVVNNLVFPLNKNVLFLLTKLFDNSTIYKILHKYTLEDIKTIYEHFEVDDIHVASKFLLNKSSTSNTLDTIEFLITKNDKEIDTEEQVVIENNTYHVGFYFLTLTNYETGKYLNLYKTLTEYKCSFNFKLINIDDKIIKRINERLILLNEMLLKWK